MFPFEKAIAISPLPGPKIGSNSAKAYGSSFAILLSCLSLSGRSVPMTIIVEPLSLPFLSMSTEILSPLIQKISQDSEVGHHDGAYSIGLSVKLNYS